MRRYNMNAKKEFLIEVSGNSVLAAEIWDDAENDRREYPNEELESGLNFVLYSDYTKEEYEKFLSALDFEYDSGYGTQELLGNIWYEDGTWSERGEYDGSEWWRHVVKPEVPRRSK
jgi:hypothetical protein